MFSLRRRGRKRKKKKNRKEEGEACRGIGEAGIEGCMYECLNVSVRI
jgi:hypothetical protein